MIMTISGEAEFQAGFGSDVSISPFFVIITPVDPLDVTPILTGMFRLIHGYPINNEISNEIFF